MANSNIRQHKEIAMGKNVTGLKSGGAVHSDAKQDKAMVRSMVKPGALAAKGGAVCGKCGKRHGGRC